VTSSAPAAPERTPVKAKKATAKAKAKAKASHVNPAKAKPKAVVHPQRPAVTRPFTPATSTHAISLPADVPAADSGSGMSTRSVLMLAFVVAVGAGLLALLAGAGWRRIWWWRRYHSYPASGRSSSEGASGPRAARMPAVPEPSPAHAEANGSNGAAAGNGEPVTIVTRADAPTRT
jgi:hypothetical protein